MLRNRSRKGRLGFTMIELMVVVVIVGVLASVAVPLYGKYVKNARLTEATGQIGSLVTAARTWAQENQAVAGNPVWPSGTSGIFDLASTQTFSYSIVSGGGANANTTALVLRATGIAGTRMAGVTVTQTIPNINSNGTAPVVTGL